MLWPECNYRNATQTPSTDYPDWTVPTIAGNEVWCPNCSRVMPLVRAQLVQTIRNVYALRAVIIAQYNRAPFLSVEYCAIRNRMIGFAEAERRLLHKLAQVQEMRS